MPVIRVAIAGLGAIGRVLARKLADGIPGLVLAGAAARDIAKAQAWLDAERIACPLVDPSWSNSQGRGEGRSSCRLARCWGSTRSLRRPKAGFTRCG
jgi:hypothetical protein